jgi:GxxExxY protein
MIPEDSITGDIIRAAVEVHRELGGPGLLESVYKGALAWELERAGRRVEREVAVPVVYKGATLSDPLKIDLLVDRQIVVEAKAAARSIPAFAVQCNTYLRLARFRIGLVINFGLPRLVDGIERIANKSLFAPGELSGS